MASPRWRKDDVTWLAREWEYLIRINEYPTKTQAMKILMSLTDAFLRGQGIRRGSIPQAARTNYMFMDLRHEIIKRVIEDDVRDLWFPALIKLGFSSWDSVREVEKDWARRE